MSTFLYPFILPVFQPLVPTCCSILLFYPALPPSPPINLNSPFPSSFIVSFPILLSAHVDLFFLLACFFFCSSASMLFSSLLVSVFILSVSFPSYHPSLFYALSITICFVSPSSSPSSSPSFSSRSSSQLHLHLLVFASLFISLCFDLSRPA
jgi:hypothetical protein